MRSSAIFLAAMCMAGCLSKEEKLALFDDDGDGFHTKFGEDWGGEQPWAIAATTVRWAQTAVLDDAPIIAAGEDAGDLFGSTGAFLDFDNDTNTDLMIGAPGVDRAGADAGAFYVLAGPR